MSTTRQAGFLIAKINQAAGRIFARMLRERGIDIHPGHGRILFVLWQHGPMPIHDLARRVSLGKSTLTNALDRLEASGDVRRVRSDEDRRSITVELTPKTAETRHVYEDVSRAMNEQFYRDIPDAEIDAFEATLKRILQNLE
ncbi:MarR family winged helix-turn-helix transcriptional regulator [Rhizomicrobium electricum]|jgi:DNA-binding MarR family transcriptional regulator|uniref:Radical SAM mobile pair system MarR family transcriptional regulator n=1 Tax=Rhizomicrobium electricum TaxID=480070 RepID=A0ABN1E2P3_9PROT|nr:MarR family transcriptional regulator [Rhizomicrobium electricum]NIJ47496.1 DNA-binding MarR family transcriptional regulator [Rhizomicrobium electricum]